MARPEMAQLMTNSPLVVRTSRWKMSAAALGCALFAWGCADTAWRDHDDFMWAGAAFFGLGALACVFVLFRAPAELVLDADALRFSQGRVTWSLPWREIAGLRLFTVRSHGIATQRNILLRDSRGVERGISSGLTINQMKLVRLIEARIASAYGEGGTSPTD